MLLRCCCADDLIRKLPPKTKKSAKMFGSYGSILYFCTVLTLKSHVVCDVEAEGIYT